MNLTRYLEIVGCAKGGHLLEMAEQHGWEPQELFDLVDQGKISSHYMPDGSRYFRCPPAADDLIGHLRDFPNSSGTSIQKVLKCSREKLNRVLSEHLSSGRITRVKDGVSWLYSVDNRYD